MLLHDKNNNILIYGKSSKGNDQMRRTKINKVKIHINEINDGCNTQAFQITHDKHDG